MYKLVTLTIWREAEARRMAKKPAERIERNIMRLLENEVKNEMEQSALSYLQVL